MKKLVIAILVLIVLFFLALNTSMMADQALKWVKENPKDPHAPKVLYDAARWCDILGDNKKALEVYWDLYQQYPENSALSAAALYYSAQIEVDTSVSKRLADPFLAIIFNQYSGESDWVGKARKLQDEVNYVR